MTSYQRMTIQILQRAKAEPSEGFRFRVVALATEFGIDQAHVRERLVRLHKDGYAVLLARDEYNRPKPFDQWRDEELFFFFNSDDGHRLARLTDKGDEMLEELAAEAGEPSQTKRAIGFHV